MIWRLLPISMAVAVAAGAALPASASACSCLPIEPRERLEDGEPAFTGRVVSRRRHEGNPELRGDETFTYIFRVGHSYNRKHRRRLRLTAGSQGAACGVLFRRGERVGAFLDRNKGELTTNLCSLVDPDDLIRAGRQVKARVTGAGPGYQTRGTAYASKTVSADTMVALSQRACAASSRSNGSL